MRVCFVTGEYPPMQGGVGDYTQRLVQALTGKAETFVLTSVKAKTVSPSPSTYPIIRRWSFLSWPLIERIAKQTAAQILHIQYQTGAFAMSPSINLLPLWARLRLRQCRVVTTFHDLRVPYLFPKAGKLRQGANRALMEGSHAIIVTNEDDLAAIESLGQRKERLVELIPIGNNLLPQVSSRFDRGHWRTRLGVKESEVLLCYFGFLNSSKGVETLLAAMRQLLDQSLPLKLLLIGAGVGDSDPTNIPYREMIQKTIDNLDLQGAIIWTGHLPPQEVSAYFYSSDICVLPFRDGASFRRTTLIAALSHGLPTITTVKQKNNERKKASTLPELIDGQNCLLVPPDNPAALTTRLKSLIISPEAKEGLSVGAKALARAFSWENIAERTLSLYRRVLSQDTS